MPGPALSKTSSFTSKTAVAGAGPAGPKGVKGSELAWGQGGRIGFFLKGKQGANTAAVSIMPHF